MQLDKLINEIDQQNTALFIGAGAARCHFLPEHQLPDGNEMKKELLRFHYRKPDGTLEALERLFRDEFRVQDEYLAPELVWDKCLGSSEELPRNTRLIREMFDYNKYIPPNYKYIAWLHLLGKKGINQVITTNFDEKIEAAYNLLQQRGLFPDEIVLPVSLDEDYRNLSSNLKNTTVIYKLHGTLSKPYSVIASVKEMTQLSEDKFEVLKNIFLNNDLVIFVGYACNDKDIYEALLEISTKTKTRVYWIKRTNNVSPGSSIHNLLTNFNSKSFEHNDNVNNYILEAESYDFFSAIFNQYVNRDEIDLPVIQNQTKNIVKKLNQNTASFLDHENDVKIFDFVHGEIKFPDEYNEELFKLINSFDLQRLRDIKQLSSAQYKFPSATHSRFSHSLGVAHLVSKALTNTHLKNTSDMDKKNTLCAALLHDIGHGPLGHVLDKFFDRIGTTNEHELYTKRFIDEGLFDLKEVLGDVSVNRNEVKNHISFKGGTRLNSGWDKAYLSWLVGNYDLDLDRIDFLMRDLLLTHTEDDIKDIINVPCLHFPKKNRISDKRSKEKGITIRNTLNDLVSDYISRLNFAKYEQLDETIIDKYQYPKDVKLLFVDDGHNYLYDCNETLDYLLGLYCHMYINIYYNDKVSCAEAMLAKALHIAYDMGDIDRSSLYKFNDSELLTYLENLESDIIREIMYSVKYRRLLKPLVKFDLGLQHNMNAVKIESVIEKEFGLNKHCYESLVIVHIPRKKKFHNLFVKNDRNKVELYGNLSHFNERLSTIKGKIFVNPNLELYLNPTLQHKLLDLLNNLGLDAKLSDDVKVDNTGKNIQTKICDL